MGPVPPARQVDLPGDAPGAQGEDPVEEAGDGPGQGMTLVKNADGTYTLAMDGKSDDDEFEDEDPFAESGEDGPPEEPAEEEDPEEAMKKAAAAMEILGKVMAEASKLKIVIGFDVPGENLIDAGRRLGRCVGLVAFDVGRANASRRRGGGQDGEEAQRRQAARHGPRSLPVVMRGV